MRLKTFVDRDAVSCFRVYRECEVLVVMLRQDSN